MNNGEMQFVFCTECGVKNDINANFCTSCGSKLTKPTPAPVIIPVTEEPVAEEPAAEESLPESPEIQEPVADEPSVEEEALPEELPVIIPEAEEEPIPEEPEAEEQIIEEKIEEEAEEEAIPEAIPVIIPEVEKAEEPAREEPKEEAFIPTAAPVSKKEEKLVKKLEEAKRQAQEEARKQAEKEAEKARKAEEKAQKAAEKEAEKARAAEEKAKKAEKKAEATAPAEAVQGNSHYYYNKNNAAAEAAAAPEMPKKKHKQNVFLKILSVLLALILSASLMIAIPITLLNMFLSDHNIELIVDRAVSSIELDKLTVPTPNGNKTISGAIHDVTSELEGWDHITEEQINEALLEDFVKKYVSNLLEGVGMSIKEGEAMLGWTPEQIYSFIEDNEDTIKNLAREAGYTGEIPIKENKDLIISNIESHIGEDGITAEALLKGSDETLDLARYLDTAQALFSIEVLCLAWGLVAFIVILIIFTNIGYFGAFCRSCGFPAFIVGTLYFLIGLGVSPLMSIVTLPIPIIENAVKFAVGFLAALLMDVSLIVLGVGLVLIIISFIADAIKRKIDSKKNA